MSTAAVRPRLHRGEARRFIAARLARVYPLHLLTLSYRSRSDHPLSPRSLRLAAAARGGLRARRPPAARAPAAGHEHDALPVVEPALVVDQHGVVDLSGVPVPRAPAAQCRPGAMGLVAVACLAVYLAIMFYLVPRVTVPPDVDRRNAGRDAAPRSTSATSTGSFAARRGSSSHADTPRLRGRTLARMAGGRADLARARDGRCDVHAPGPSRSITVALFPLLVLSAAFGGRRLMRCSAPGRCGGSANGRTPST